MRSVLLGQGCYYVEAIANWRSSQLETRSYIDYIVTRSPQREAFAKSSTKNHN